MKKLIILILVIIVNSMCLSALADSESSSYYKADLEQLFDNDNLLLVRAEFPTVTAENFEFNYEFLDQAMDKNPADLLMEIKEYIASGGEFQWLSLSPSGNAGILAANEDTEDEVRIGYYNGKFHFLFPCSHRGVEDVNGNLKAQDSKLRLRRLIGEDGVVYSPDGRYAALINHRITMEQSQFVLDPVVIDLATGEMILTATYGNRMLRGTAGAVTTATFSSDGRYFYYMLYGDINKFRTALYRYDMKLHKTELCCSANDGNYYPGLSETDNGTIVALRNAVNRKSQSGSTDYAPAGITYYTQETDMWKARELYFGLPMEHWNCNRLVTSLNSDYAFIQFWFNKDYPFVFQSVMLDEDCSGINRYYAISKNENMVLSYSLEEINALFDPVKEYRGDMPVDNQKDRINISLEIPFHEILQSIMSPDGHYVLLLTNNCGSRDNEIEFSKRRHLYLLRLDDLSIREVHGVNAGDIAFGVLWGGMRSIEWNTDTLIINTASDGMRAYQFMCQ